LFGWCFEDDWIAAAVTTVAAAAAFAASGAAASVAADITDHPTEATKPVLAVSMKRN